MRGSRDSAARWLAGVLVVAGLLGAAWFFSLNEAIVSKPGRRLPHAAGAGFHSATEVSEPLPKVTDTPHALAGAKADECGAWQSLRDWAVPALLRQADVQAEAKESMHAALMELRAMPDERSRALSASLGYRFEGFDPTVVKPSNEALTPEQKAANKAVAVGQYSGHAQRLVDLAANSTDAVVYATAYLHCDRAAWMNEQAKTSCARLSAAQWARIDPDNAAPWMHQAQTAAGAGDHAAVAEAFFRVSQARRNTDHQRVAAQALLANLPENTSEEAVAVIGDLFVGGDAAVPARGYEVLTSHCSAARLAFLGGDANRRQTCSDVADVLSQRGMSLFDLGTAIRLAKNGAWPVEKLTLAQSQLDELMRVAQSQIVGDSSSCQGSKKAADYRRDWVALGEVQALRQRVVNTTSATR